MARFTRMEVLNSMVEIGLVPVFYHKDLETAKKIVQACADGGAKVVEFTNRGDFAYQTFTELARFFQSERPDVILGVGSVVDAPTAAMYIASGANFVVGPVFNAEVARLCNRRKIAYSPGCGSASEISDAEEVGVEIVKVFPGKEVGGPEFVKNMLGPCPWTKIMPTGGVDTTRESIHAWIKAGAACLGVGSNLITKELVAAGDFSGITKKAESCLWWIKEARGVPLFTGVEHLGLYPVDGVSGANIAEWYEKTFGFAKKEGTSSIFLSGGGPGRIEVMKEGSSVRPHVAVRVSNFEEACKMLKEKGIKLEEPKIKSGVKSAFLAEPDAAGNRVHILYMP
jgi:2-dehydro-3-deoxyphosphogluconate aldolase/(4S)-4-hydroxy-2-oxoglutarate aldolase